MFDSADYLLKEADKKDKDITINEGYLFLLEKLFSASYDLLQAESNATFAEMFPDTKEAHREVFSAIMKFHSENDNN